MIQAGDVIQWRGLARHEGVVVEVERRVAWIAYLDNPGELKDAAVCDLRAAEGRISDEDQKVIDDITRAWFPR